MNELDELLAGLDDEAAEKLKAILASKDTALKIKERDLNLSKNKELKELYPRAWKAMEKGRLALGDAVEEKDIKKMLADKEEELADMGVPLPSDHPAAVKPQQPEEDPGQAFGQVVSGGTPAPARDVVAEAEGALAGNTKADRQRFTELLFQMNDEQRGYFAQKLSAPPIPDRHGPIPIG